MRQLDHDAHFKLCWTGQYCYFLVFLVFFLLFYTIPHHSTLGLHLPWVHLLVAAGVYPVHEELEPVLASCHRHFSEAAVGSASCFSMQQQGPKPIFEGSLTDSSFSTACLLQWIIGWLHDSLINLLIA